MAHPGGSRRPVTTKKYFVRGPWAPKPGSPRAHLEPPGVRQRGRRAGARAPPNQMLVGPVWGAPAAATQAARAGRLRPTHISCEVRGHSNRASLVHQIEPWRVRQRGWRAGATAPPNQMLVGLVTHGQTPPQRQVWFVVVFVSEAGRPFTWRSSEMAFFLFSSGLTRSCWPSCSRRRVCPPRLATPRPFEPLKPPSLSLVVELPPGCVAGRSS